LISIKNCPKNKLKKEIVIVWFKRDLRFTDHEALFYAQKQSLLAENANQKQKSKYFIIFIFRIQNKLINPCLQSNSIVYPPKKSTFYSQFY
jgi:hypothetical protein